MTSRRSDFAALLLLSCFAAAVYWQIISYRTFGAEYPMFYMYGQGQTFTSLIGWYLQLNSGWYRPTAFYTPYYVGRYFLDWHNTAGWKIYELFTGVASAFLIYGLCVETNAGRFAGILAGIYFLSHPALFECVSAIAAFDFTYIVFVLLSALFFLRALRAPSQSERREWIASILAFVAALTSKELSIAAPAYLFCLGLLFRTGEKTIRDVVRLVAPFFALVIVYFFAHVMRIPKTAYSNQGDYRDALSASIVFENLAKYPLIMMRIFRKELDPTGQTSDYATSGNLAVGLTLLIFTVAVWIVLWRKRPDLRIHIWAALAALIVFLAVPVYSGRYFHHANLPMVGYACLFGIAASSTLSLIRNLPARTTVTAAIILVFAYLGYADAFRSLTGRLGHIHRLNYNALNNPPRDPIEMRQGAPFVYVEDREGRGIWTYGVKHLFQYSFLNPKIREDVVPPMNQTSTQQCRAWLQQPRAYYFSYDSVYRWSDQSQAFRKHCEALVQ